MHGVAIHWFRNDLRLADNHGIEAGCNTKQMADRVDALIGINMLVQRSRVTIGFLLFEEVTDNAAARPAISHRGNHFNAIAGRQNHAFKDCRIRPQPSQPFTDIGMFECYAFAHFDGSATMI